MLARLCGACRKGHLRLFQMERVEAFREPAGDGSRQVTGFPRSADKIGSALACARNVSTAREMENVRWQRCPGGTHFFLPN